MKAVLVTGHAGFIGSNLVKRVFKELSDATIVGMDNLNDNYDPSLKEYRLDVLEQAKPTGFNCVGAGAALLTANGLKNSLPSISLIWL